MSGLTAWAPAKKPASNFSISGVSTPPTKPMWSVVVFSAAATPARNEPCSSANSRPVRLSAPISATDESMIANVVSGYCSATSPMTSP